MEDEGWRKVEGNGKKVKHNVNRMSLPGTLSLIHSFAFNNSS
jgi:hypothetical protein